jgi:hypothetical protein
MTFTNDQPTEANVDKAPMGRLLSRRLALRRALLDLGSLAAASSIGGLVDPQYPLSVLIASQLGQ